MAVKKPIKPIENQFYIKRITILRQGHVFKYLVHIMTFFIRKYLTLIIDIYCYI